MCQSSLTTASGTFFGMEMMDSRNGKPHAASRGRILGILGAVPFETDPLLDLFDEVRSLPFMDGTLHFGSYRDWPILLGSTGLGKVNGAATAAALLERFPMRMIWSVGCAGAFVEGPLRVGDVLVASSSLCGDEGVLTHDRLLSTSLMGIPILTDGENQYYDHIPLDRTHLLGKIMELTPQGVYRWAGPGRAAVHERTKGGQQALGMASGALMLHGSTESVAESAPSRGSTRQSTAPDTFRLFHGPSLTVSMTSGDGKVAENRFLRYGAFAENMEGSAIAQACFRYRVPVAECRGISNMAGNRRKGEWRLQEAVSHCHGIVLHWIEHLTPSDWPRAGAGSESAAHSRESSANG